MGRSVAAPRWSLVLSGGDGRRLQDLTRQITGFPIPKQYCRIMGSQSLLESTLARSMMFAPPVHTMVIVNRDHLPIGGDQLRGLVAENVIVQPCNRDTGPGILLALLHLRRRVPNAIVALFPSDHYVEGDEAFMAHVRRAAEITAGYPEKLVVLGIRPSRPESSYGYITPSTPLSKNGGAPLAFRVAAFREKPPAEAAKALLAAGGLWNSFVMVFQMSRMFELLHRVAPNELRYMQALSGQPARLAARYPDLAPWNFSSHFLARIPQHLVVLPVDDVHWSDWGTRESIESTLKRLKQTPPWYGSPPSQSAA